MRTFTLGNGGDRKVVKLDVVGATVVVIEDRADGTSSRKEKPLHTQNEARALREKMAQALLDRGFREREARVAPRREAPVLDALFEEDDGSADVAAPLPPLMTAALPDAAPKKKKKKKKSSKGKAKDPAQGDGLDKKVVAGVLAAAVLFVGFLGYMAYDTFLKPASIVGSWKGSKLTYEPSKPMILTQYQLVLDEKNNAVMTLQESLSSSGTYSLKGNRLKLNLKDEDGYPVDLEYKVSLGRMKLDLLDPTTGDTMVELIRLPEAPRIGGKGGRSPSPDMQAVAAAPVGKGDKAADAKIASIEYAAKDAAFKLRYPQGWEATTGSRPDNTYSWAKFLKGSSKIHVQADVQGSLMSGSDSAQPHEPGSEYAPVQTAHDLYKKTASEEYSDYSESKATLFEGSELGEGRIATFVASEGGLFGGKLKGYRVTLLTNDRRVTILCHAPESDFAKLSPVFLAVCRSLSR